jgi:monoterpene epsilon-lactone hydrolase
VTVSAEFDQVLTAQRAYKDQLAGTQDLEEMRRLDRTEISKWAGPLPQDVSIEEVNADGVPAEWLFVPGAVPGRVILYVHGGGLVLGSPVTVRNATAYAARVAGAIGLLPDYRLAPEHVHPAALEDVLTTYRWLLASGTPPEGIVIAGESAGGWLVCGVLLALRDAGDPLPAAAVPISAMVDLEFSGESWSTNAEKDGFVTRELAVQNVPMFLPGGDPAAHSPTNANLAGLPPLLLQVGSSEVIRDDVTAFAEKARAAGVDVTLEIWEGMVHLWHTFSYLPEAQQALERMGQFVKEHTEAAPGG